MTALLEAAGLRREFAGVVAVDGVSLRLQEGEVLGLIGPNGAGKSTVINLLSGFDRVGAGSVRLAGRDITRESSSRIARAGLVRTFQHMRLFSSLTVRQNVETAAHARHGAGVAETLLGLPRARRAQRAVRELADELLDTFELEPLADQRATTLSYGSQRRVEIVRALATSPRVLLLDEPAAGMDEREAAGLSAFLERTRERHPVSILLVEHHLDVVMRLCDRVLVLDAGRVLADGPPREVTADPAVLEAYVGEEVVP
jgi:ABC-type branched-subunit amino acid transport system ATPase component